MFTKIPLELLMEIKSYLLKRNYWKFLLACNRFFADIRFHTGKIVLDEKGTDRFFDEPEFRECILSKIKGKYGQLSFRADRSFFGMSDRVRCSLLQTPSCDLFCTAEELLSFPDWRNFIDNRYEVSLRRSSTITAFPRDLNIQRLDLFMFSALSDVSCFSHLKFLSLSQCDKVQDVNCLRNVEDLSIDSCFKIIDVSGLGKVHRLHLRDLPLVKDISALTENYALTITGLRGIEIVPRVMNLANFSTDLTFSLLETISFPKLKSFGPFTTKATGNVPVPLERFLPFQNLFCLHLSFCHNLTKLDGMNKIPVLVIDSCLGVTDISALGGNQSVSLIHCAISDFRPLKNIPVVLLRRCAGFTDQNSDFDWTVRHLTIDDCSYLKDVSKFGKIKHLELYTRVDDFEGLSNVPTLEFEFDTAFGKTPADYFQSLENGNNNKIVFPPVGGFKNFLVDFSQINDFDVIPDKFTEPNDMRTRVTLLRKQPSAV
jgi:hypothetical protein